MVSTNITSKISGFLYSFSDFQVNNYYLLHVFAVVYALVGIPILITIFPQLPSLIHQLLAICAIFLPIFSAELFWKQTIEKNPIGYIKTLRLKTWTIRIFWILFVFFIASLTFLYASLSLKMETIMIPSLAIFALTFEAIAGYSIVESCLLFLDLPAVYSKKYKKIFLRRSAHAYFMIVSTEKDLTKNVLNFKLGLDCINNYIRTSFNKFALLKIDEYYNYFRIQAFSVNEEEKDRIREALRDFAYALNNELDLTDTLRATINIMGKQFVSIEAVAAQELDFDTGVRKTLLKNQQLIMLIIVIATFIVSVIALFALFR